MNFYRKYSIERLIKKEKENHPICTYLLGMHHLLNKNYDVAFTLIKKATDLNVEDSYYDLGMCYKFGEGTEQNVLKAYTFFEKAEKLGKDSRTYYELGLIYKKGILYLNNNNIFIDKDYKKAFYYFELAFNKNLNSNNISEILYQIGLCYKNGEGVNKDEKKAFDLFTESLFKKYITAVQLEIALCYKNGIGVEKDEKKAHNIFRKIIASNKCKCYCDNKKIIVENLISYYENKKELSDVNMYNLANYYYMNGNYDKAFDKYEESAFNNYAPAQYGLFYCYYKGKGVVKNNENAIKWLKLSANQNYNQAITKCIKFDIEIEI